MELIPPVCFLYILSSWKYWKSKSPTFSIILEVLQIEVSNIFCNPRNTGGGQAAPPARFSWLGLVLEHCSWKSVTALENNYYFFQNMAP